MASHSALLLALITVGIWLPNLDLSQGIVQIITWIVFFITGCSIFIILFELWTEWQESKGIFQ